MSDCYVAEREYRRWAKFRSQNIWDSRRPIFVNFRCLVVGNYYLSRQICFWHLHQTLLFVAMRTFQNWVVKLFVDWPPIRWVVKNGNNLIIINNKTLDKYLTIIKKVVNVFLIAVLNEKSTYTYRKKTHSLYGALPKNGPKMVPSGKITSYCARKIPVQAAQKFQCLNWNAKL